MKQSMSDYNLELQRAKMLVAEQDIFIAAVGEWQDAWRTMRDSILNERDALAEMGMDGDKINAVLSVIDNEEPKIDDSSAAFTRLKAKIRREVLTEVVNALRAKADEIDISSKKYEDIATAIKEIATECGIRVAENLVRRMAGNAGEPPTPAPA